MCVKLICSRKGTLHFASLSLFLSSPKATAAAAGEESPRASLPSSLRRVHAHATIEAPKPDRTVPFLPLPLLFLRDYLQSDQKRILQMNSLSTAWARRSRSILPGHPVRDVVGESRAPVLFWPPVAAYQFPYGLRHRFFDRGGHRRRRRRRERRQDDPRPDRDTDRKSASSPSFS